MLRIATFNLENLDDKPGDRPTLAKRIAVMRPQLERLQADILCLQEVNGQEQPQEPRQLLALDQLLADTPYADFHRAATHTVNNPQVYDQRNLVILSRYPISVHRQHKHDFTPAPAYREVTASPPQTDADEVTWERSILYAQIELTDGPVHVINLHLKSRLPSTIPGQRQSRYQWRSVVGWAEGFFLSSMKRVGQALETRMLIDDLFDANPQARIAVCGDFNAEHGSVPLQAICGNVEDTGNAELDHRVMVPCELSIAPALRYTLYHHGQGVMIDHVVVSRALMAAYRGSEIHNEMLHDESVSFTGDVLFPESDHAPVVATFDVA